MAKKNDEVEHIIHIAAASAAAVGAGLAQLPGQTLLFYAPFKRE